MIKVIGVMTPGGDAPGMNAAIRAVVRSAIFQGLKVIGVERGFEGLIRGEMREMGLGSVSGIISHGGTILKTIRSNNFRRKSSRRIAARNLKLAKIDGLVVIGGDGSMRAASILSKESGVRVVHIPASIDNDIPYTDDTVGFDTAVNTALDAIDKIRDTASSHERVFVVEVMGRDAGHLALEVGITAGVEVIMIPERKTSVLQVCSRLREGILRGKKSSIVVVAEGVASGHDVADVIRKKLKVNVRVSVLGYIQRGGSPTADSRKLASVLGAKAVELLVKGQRNKMVGVINNKIVATDFARVVKAKKKINMSDYKLAERLSI
jgi:6-phosphofructokinase 1